MKAFVKRMINEHRELVNRIANLHNYVYSPNNNDDKIEFANKAIQLAAMKKYEEALRARLENQNIVVTDEGEYFASIDPKTLDTDTCDCECKVPINNETKE